MHRRTMLKTLGGLMLCPLCTPLARGFEYTGEHGPDHWGGVCNSGSRQSPIDIGAAYERTLSPLWFTWPDLPKTIENTGHTIMVNFDRGANFVAIGRPDVPGNKRFFLTQFHFHHPGEHQILGSPSAMEVHFVHDDGSEGLLVLAVMMKAGKTNDAFARVVATMPATGVKDAVSGIDPRYLVPRFNKYYAYEGSLTTPTPDCLETVHWRLAEAQLEVAQADIDSFKAIYPLNARPVQRKSYLKDGWYTGDVDVSQAWQDLSHEGRPPFAGAHPLD